MNWGSAICFFLLTNQNFFHRSGFNSGIQFLAPLAHLAKPEVLMENERWRNLCTSAAKEQDPAKLLALVQEITRILEQKEARLRGNSSAKLNPGRTMPVKPPARRLRQMASQQSPYVCPICHKPVNLEQDRYADEDGKIVHESCYIKRLAYQQNDPPDPHHAE